MIRIARKWLWCLAMRLFRTEFESLERHTRERAFIDAVLDPCVLIDARVKVQIWKDHPMRRYLERKSAPAP